MKDAAKPQSFRHGYIWFKASIAIGMLLGLVLLAQTITTYYYVSGALVRQEAQREADRKVASIARSSRAANIHDPAALGPVIDELRREAPLEVAWVRIVEPDRGVVAETGNPVGPAPVIHLRRGPPSGSGKNGEIRSASAGKVLVFTPPLRLGFGAGRGTVDVEIAIYLDGVSVSFARLRENLIVGCSAAIALVAALLIIGLRFRHYLRGKQFEQQLEMARAVQFDLLPSTNPVSNKIEFAAECIPAWQVGGDFYDVFELEHGQIGLALGDVSGKGMSAALLMALMHGAVHSSLWTGPASNHEESTERLNRLLCEKSSRERFASLFWCYFDPETASLKYINAGHLPPLLVRQEDDTGFEVERLEEGGPVLGVLPSAIYRQGTVEIRAGDLLVIYSDGILEAQNAADDEFGEERMIDVIRRNRDKSASEICRAIFSAVRAFIGGQPPHDDQTLMVVRLAQVGRSIEKASFEAVAT